MTKRRIERKAVHQDIVNNLWKDGWWEKNSWKYIPHLVATARTVALWRKLKKDLSQILNSTADKGINKISTKRRK